MSITTIMGKLKASDTELCYRSLANLENQKVTPYKLARDCDGLGWRCMLVDDRVYVAKTEAGLEKFQKMRPEGSYREL